MTAALLVLGGTVLLTIVSGVYVFLIGFVRNKDIPWLVENEIRKTPLGQYYQHIAEADQWIREHNSYGISMESYDGLKLHGLWIPADNAKGTILLVHGYRSNFLVDFGPALSLYHDMGWNMLIPEQRAHGESEGKLITFGIKESDDMCRWIDYHNRSFGKHPVVLSGLSMGASTVIYMLKKDLPNNVRGIIADCGFTSPAAILSVIFQRVTHLPAFPTLLVTDMLARLVSGISIWGCDSVKILQKSKQPILMIHGTGDEFVPCKMTEQAFNVCSADKQLLLVSDAAHGESFLEDPDSYTKTVRAFLDSALSDNKKGM